MASKNKYNKEEAKALSLELQAEILKLKSSLARFENDVVVLQTGDKNGPYWNGENAYDVYKSSLGHLDHDNNLIKNIEKCSEYIEITINK